VVSHVGATVCYVVLMVVTRTKPTTKFHYNEYRKRQTGNVKTKITCEAATAMADKACSCKHASSYKFLRSKGLSLVSRVEQSLKRYNNSNKETDDCVSYTTALNLLSRVKLSL
jgi:predicted RNase H-related nuclease YkuK (DUF458 family)